MSLKVDGYLKPFRGSGDNFEAFWQKFLILARLQKWEADDGSSNKLDFLPMLLAGDAFHVWNQLSDADKKDLAKTKDKLTSAFCVTKAQAYQLFRGCVLPRGESIEAYVADRRLWALWPPGSRRWEGPSRFGTVSQRPTG